MTTIAKSYKSMSVLMLLSWDRVFFTAALIGALYAGSYFALLGVTH